MRTLKLTAMFIFSWIVMTGAAFAQPMCSSGANWSLAAAEDHLINANLMATGLGGANCTGVNYTVCRDILRAVTLAQDHIYQVFDHNYNSRNNCKKCNLASVVQLAAQIRQWEDWLLNRYHRSAYGVGNIHFTISQYRNVPYCRSGGSLAGMEPGVNRPGSDYRSFFIANDPGICKSECERDGRCRSWTFVKPGIQGAQAKCWLKNRIPRARNEGCCVSGVVRSAGASSGSSSSSSGTGTGNSATGGGSRSGGALQCPTRVCGGPYTASQPRCLAFNNGAGACPRGYHSKNRYGVLPGLLITDSDENRFPDAWG